MNKVLVGISTYNNYGYLWKTFRNNFELSGCPADWFVMDDGSNKENREQLEKDIYIQSKSNVHYNTENSGISAIKNYFFSLAENYEYVVCLDNDIMLTFNWLSELINGMENHPEVGVGAPLIYNDTTMLQKVSELKGKPFNSNFHYVDGLGAACTIIPNKVFLNIKYNRSRKTYLYEDADFHGRVLTAGYALSVFLSVQALHLPWVVWLDKDYELNKLNIRHLSRRGSMDGFAESADRMQERLLNRFIKKD